MGVGAGTAAGIAAAGSVASAGIGMLGSHGAAGAASGADQQAAAEQQAQYQLTHADLAPYNAAGQANLPSLTQLGQSAPVLMAGAYNNAAANIPSNFTQAQLENNPGYQFQVQQAAKAAQSSAAARGLGVSGAALKAADSYGQGLASSNWQQLFNNQNTTFQDYNQQFANTVSGLNSQYQYLMGPAQLGENAAAMSGMQGTQAAANAGNALQAAGGAQAAGISGATQAATSGLSALGNLPTNYLAMQKLFNNNGGGFDGPTGAGTGVYPGSGDDVPITG